MEENQVYQIVSDEKRMSGARSSPLGLLRSTIRSFTYKSQCSKSVLCQRVIALYWLRVKVINGVGALIRRCPWS